jgi:hypothetical protein
VTKITESKKSRGISERKIIVDYGFINPKKGVNSITDKRVSLGIIVSRGLYYKITKRESGRILKGGYVPKGLNIIYIPFRISHVKKRDEFYIYFKWKDKIEKKIITFSSDRNLKNEESEEINISDSVRDKKIREIDVSEKVLDIPESIKRSSRIDPATGEHPSLSGGVPILPLLYLLGKKIFSGKKKRRKKIINLKRSALFSVSENIDSEISQMRYHLIHIKISDTEKVQSK